MNIPARLAAGDSFTWKDGSTKDNLGNAIDASGWTLKYAIRGAATLDLTATVIGLEWQTSITKAQSTSLPPGVYFWQAYVDNPGLTSRITLNSGQIEITPDLTSATTGFDGRTQSEIDLAAVQLAMRTLISGGAVQKYMIGNRSVEKMTMADLIMHETRLKYRVNQEKAAQTIKNNLGNPNNMFVRFK